MQMPRKTRMSLQQSKGTQRNNLAGEAKEEEDPV
jgi:hypothetical protein